MVFGLSPNFMPEGISRLGAEVGDTLNIDGADFEVDDLVVS